MADPPGDHEPGQTGNRESWGGASAANADVQDPRSAKMSTEARSVVDLLKHYRDADQALGLTDQEREIYAHHLNNLTGTGRYDHGDGSVSTYFGMSVGGADVGGDPARTYMIPKVHDGHIVDDGEALDIARMRGADRHASYDSPEAAKQRYDAIHEYMDRDAEDHMHRTEGPDSELRRRYLAHRAERAPGLMNQTEADRR